MECFIMALVLLTIGMILVTVFADLDQFATKSSITIRDCEMSDCETCAQGAFQNSFER
jgi:hypothetical protein